MDRENESGNAAVGGVGNDHLLFLVFPQGPRNQPFPPAGLMVASLWSDRLGRNPLSCFLEGKKEFRSKK